MINYIWAVMIIIGIIYGAFSGNLGNISAGVVNGAKEAVTLSMTLVGIIAMWTGLMKIAEKSGLINLLSIKLRPLLRFLFPNIPSESKANKYIATNIIANFLGLGWAATPPGLKAMEELQKLNKSKEIASVEMCTFLIINISSVQLISINMIAYRMEYASKNPTEIVGPALIATIISTAVGVVFCKIMMGVVKR
jgi:spore maturation protein A